ncbi:MAG: nickel-dependent lactate racemase [Anaerolineales bacterium]
MNSKIQIEIPYGEETIRCTVPTANLKGIHVPHEVPPVQDEKHEIRRALDHPIEAPPLQKVAQGAERVVIVADDNTRLTPTHIIVPLLLNALNAAGVPDEAVEILIALGTHRQMTESEIEQKFGSETTGRTPVINHNCNDDGALVDLGITPGGVSVQVNRRVLEADLVLGVGSIVPHHIPGFSGGAKIIQPGVCGARTTGQIHLLSVRRPTSLLGRMENEVRREMEAIAERAGLRAILNTILDSEGRLIRAVYGDPRPAFRRGVEVSRRVYGVPVPEKTDIVIASSHPCDIEFWQAHKTLYPAQRCVREGGTIIVVTPCPEGLSVTHPEIAEYAGREMDEIDAAIHSGEIEDLTAGALALAWASVRRHADVAMVSDGIGGEVAQRVGFHPYATLQEALDAALDHHGRDATISVLPYAPDTLPLRCGGTQML